MTLRLPRALGLASWYVANALLALALFTYAMPEFADGRVVYPSSHDLYAMTRMKLAPWWPASLAVLIPVAVASLTALFWIAASLFNAVLARLSLLGAAANAKRSIAWASRNYFCTNMLWLSIAPAALLAVALALGLPESWLFAIGAVCALAACLLPTLALNIDSLSATRHGFRRSLRWPGWRYASLFLAVTVVFFVGGLLMSALTPARLPWHAAADVSYYLVDAIVTGALLWLVIHRAPLSAFVAELRRRAKPDFIAAWLILDLHLAVILAWLAPPLVLSMLASIYVWPQLQHTLSAAGADAGSPSLAFAHLTAWMATHWILLALPLNTFLTMVSAKLLMEFDAGKRSRAQSEPSETMPHPQIRYRQLTP